MRPRGRIVVLPVHLEENTARQIEKLVGSSQETAEEFVGISMAYGLFEACELLAKTPIRPIRISNRKELMVAVTQPFSDILRTIGAGAGQTTGVEAAMTGVDAATTGAGAAAGCSVAGDAARPGAPRSRRMPPAAAPRRRPPRAGGPPGRRASDAPGSSAAACDSRETSVDFRPGHGPTIGRAGARYREIEGVEGDVLITEVWVVPDGQIERLSLEVVAVALADTPGGEGPPQQDRHSGEPE